jgi:hypothetical protein
LRSGVSDLGTAGGRRESVNESLHHGRAPHLQESGRDDGRRTRIGRLRRKKPYVGAMIIARSVFVDGSIPAWKRYGSRSR